MSISCDSGTCSSSLLLLESDLLYEEKFFKELISDDRENIIATSDHTNSGDEIYVKDDDSMYKEICKK